MSLTILPRRVALRSAARSTPWARQFSTVVDDTFSPVAPASAPPAPPQPRKGRVLEEAVNATAPRYDWTKDEIREVRCPCRLSDLVGDDLERVMLL